MLEARKNDKELRDSAVLPRHSQLANMGVGKWHGVPDLRRREMLDLVGAGATSSCSGRELILEIDLEGIPSPIECRHQNEVN